MKGPIPRCQPFCNDLHAFSETRYTQRTQLESACTSSKTASEREDEAECGSHKRCAPRQARLRCVHFRAASRNELFKPHLCSVSWLGPSLYGRLIMLEYTPLVKSRVITSQSVYTLVCNDVFLGIIVFVAGKSWRTSTLQLGAASVEPVMAGGQEQ